MRSISEKRGSARGLPIWVIAVLAFAIATNVPRVSAQDYERTRTKHVDCDRGESITRVLAFVDPGDTVFRLWFMKFTTGSGPVSLALVITA